MPDILLLYKISAFKAYYANRDNFPAHLRGHHKHASRFERTHSQHTAAIHRVEQTLKDFGLKYHKRARGKVKDYRPYKYLITIGGDGTVLAAAAAITDQIVVGVNSDPQWSVGQFCPFNAATFVAAAECIRRDKVRLRRVPRMRLVMKGHDVRRNVLNDLLVCHKNPAAMSRYVLQLKGRKEEQRSSGVWVATAAGSTGAIASAGGRVLPIQSKTMQYMPRELYSGIGSRYRLRGGTFRDQPLVFRSMMKDGVVFVDGQHTRLNFHFGETLEAQPGGDPLRMMI